MKKILTFQLVDLKIDKVIKMNEPINKENQEVRVLINRKNNKF